MERENEMEKQLERVLTEGHLDKPDKQLEAVKRLPPRWVAVYPSSFHQVDEESKRLRKFIKEEKKKARNKDD